MLWSRDVRKVDPSELPVTGRQQVPSSCSCSSRVSLVADPPSFCGMVWVATEGLADFAESNNKALYSSYSHIFTLVAIQVPPRAHLWVHQALLFPLSISFLSCTHHCRALEGLLVLICDPCGAARCCGADGSITFALIPCKIQGVCLSQKQFLKSRVYMFFLNSSHLLVGKLGSVHMAWSRQLGTQGNTMDRL